MTWDLKALQTGTFLNTLYQGNHNLTFMYIFDYRELNISRHNDLYKIIFEYCHLTFINIL